MLLSEQHIKAAFEEAMRRYPDAENGLMWFYYASGLGLSKPTQADLDYAKSVIESKGLKP